MKKHPIFLESLILKYLFGTVKLLGLSRHGPQDLAANKSFETDAYGLSQDSRSNVLYILKFPCFYIYFSFLYLSPISVQIRARQNIAMAYFVEVSLRMTKIIDADVLSICDLTELEKMYHSHFTPNFSQDHPHVKPSTRS